MNWGKVWDWIKSLFTPNPTTTRINNIDNTTTRDIIGNNGIIGNNNIIRNTIQLDKYNKESRYKVILFIIFCRCGIETNPLIFLCIEDLTQDNLTGQLIALNDKTLSSERQFYLTYKYYNTTWGEYSPPFKISINNINLNLTAQNIQPYHIKRGKAIYEIVEIYSNTDISPIDYKINQDFFNKPKT